MRVLSLLFAAAQLQVHEFSATMDHCSIRFTVSNDTYIPDGRVETTVYWGTLLPSYTHTAPLSEYMKVPLYPGTHTFSANYRIPTSIWGVAQMYTKVFNASGSQLLWISG
jgi:hypothetical protein